MAPAVISLLCAIHSGQETKLSRDADGIFPMRFEDAAGHVTHFRWDEARRLALSRGLGHADVWDAARGRPAYRGDDDAAARDVKPHLSGERRTRLQHSWHRTYKMG